MPSEESRRKRRKFTPEFKQGAVRLVQEEGKSRADVARDLGVHESVIGTWVKQAQIDTGQGPSGAVTAAEREELARLRKENRELRMEREILKNYQARACPSAALETPVP